ncbi:MAG: hypothetical protein JJLCMIEE_03575 [Acidimicrobiales bacterium]|nr:hypothetical protein [Acidimicrobiales bacterium]RIK03766.1 MAG: hypothetical protein DCC48_15685 [Acidobacteriota bacterium]
MATKQQHRLKANPRAALQDWLTLVDPDGAFLTTSELNATFLHGFEQMDRDLRTELRARAAAATEAGDPTSRRELTRWLLDTALEWDDLLADGQRIPATATVTAADQGVTLRPHYVLLDADDATKIRLGVFTWPNGTPIDRRLDPTASGGTWPASPVQRAETWCRESGTPLALVTDDDAWALVWAPRGAPAASCRWTIADLADETILQAGLVSLLGARRFFAVSDDPKTGETLERLFERAVDAEAELTKGLGSSVRGSVELLVAATSRDDVAHNGKVLAGVAATEVYESAVTVLMRLVFLLFAEERRLLPAEDPLWSESYSVLTLRDDLRQAATRDGLDALERRATAWHRLLATFRAVHGGVNHDRLTLPAYGGSLFDPDRFPFLEGRRAPEHIVAGGVDLGPSPDAEPGPGRPVAIDDRTVLAILDALLTVQVKSGRTKVAQRVSYKALDVEQIGHCYEGLLDHSCVPVDELALGLVGPEANEPEITVADLEQFGDDPAALCEWLSDKTRCKKKASALAKLVDQEPEGVDLARLRVACGHDDDIVERVLPFWGLIRPDLRGLPVVLLPGSMFVTQTSTRRNMGAQYTTKALAEEVVQYALEPLVYDPGPQNEPDQARWKLKTPAAILDLRVCDPAVGSGAILTAAGRFLADRLIESVLEYGPGEGQFASRLNYLTTAATDEQTVLARREVVDHCLYAVDKNPVAAEMAKLSLWLTTMARERPFTFLDHAIQVGDSLLGITDIDQLRWLHLDPSERWGKRGFESLALDMRLKEATELARRVREMSVVTVRDAEEKRHLNDELQEKLADLAVVADAVAGAALSTATKGGVSMEQRLDPEMDRIRTSLDENGSGPEREAALMALRGVSTGWLRIDLPDDIPTPWDRHCLHWPLAFPEVFLDGGPGCFDAMVANPPFLGGKRVSGQLGSAYRGFCMEWLAGSRGNVDLVAFFLQRMGSVSRGIGTIATNSVAQGDTREAGLSSLLGRGWVVHRAESNYQWPGDAAVVVSLIWLRRDWDGQSYVNGVAASSIDSSLTRTSRVLGDAYPLASHAGNSYQGSILVGRGFVLDEEEAARLLRGDPRNSQVVRRYLGGADLNKRPDQSASRWAIDFFERSEQEARSFAECWRIIEERVKPERRRKKDDGSFALRSPQPERYWQYADKRPALYRLLERRDTTVAIAQVSKTLMPARIDADQVLDAKLIVFPLASSGVWGVLSSSFHQLWVIRWTTTLKTDLTYVPTRVFDTYSFPADSLLGGVSESIEHLDEFRSNLMASYNEGLTKTYNRVHDREESDPAIESLRKLHVELDVSVRDAYGWSDIDLDHHHSETPQGMRFTLSPESKDEILDRLLELNHERYAEEVAAGLHDKKAKKSTKKRASKKASEDQGKLL